MVTVPAATPVALPVAEPMVAIPVLLLVHEPPVVALERVVEVPTQSGPGAVIGSSVLITLTVVMTVQPSGDW